MRLLLLLAAVTCSFPSRAATGPSPVSSFPALAAGSNGQLALEAAQRSNKLAATKLRFYQRLRGFITDYGLSGLALTAEQLGRLGTNSSSALQQRLAGFARSMVEVIDSRSPADWMEIASRLRSWKTNPPPSLGMVLALGFSAGGMTDLALSEIESVDGTRLSTTNEVTWYHLERGAIFAFQGWDRSAAQELDLGVGLSPKGWHGVGSAHVLALFHFWLADRALQRGDQQQAALELEQASPAWPDSPLVGLLAGERMAALGQWAKAADWLEAQAATTKNSWMMQQLLRRARELRDSKGKAPSLLSQPGRLVEFVAQVVGEKIIEDAARKKVQELFSGAQAFGEQMMEMIPGMGGGR